MLLVEDGLNILIEAPGSTQKTSLGRPNGPGGVNDISFPNPEILEQGELGEYVPQR